MPNLICQFVFMVSRFSMCMDHPVKEEGPLPFELRKAEREGNQFKHNHGRQTLRGLFYWFVLLLPSSLPPSSASREREGRVSECCCRLLGTTMAKSCGRFESGLPLNNWLNPVGKLVALMRHDKSWTSLVNLCRWTWINLILVWWEPLMLFGMVHQDLTLRYLV